MAIEKMNFEHTNEITVVNKPQFDAHIRLYEGYVNKINEIDKDLSEDPQISQANATYSKYRGLKRGETFAMNGVILHELYFQNMGGTQNEPDEATMNRIGNAFGDFEHWKEDFIATAKASRGWAVLVFDQRSRGLRNASLDLHDYGNITLSFPILVLDVYEHAYFLQYADNKNAYINNFMYNTNWDVVRRRLMKI